MTEINEIVGYLEQWEPFSLLDPEQRSWAAGRCTVEYRRAGSVLLAAGVDNDELMLIVKGAAELRDGEEALVTKLAEGECIGVLSAVTGQPVRQSSVLAEDTVFCRFGGDVVAQLRSASVPFDRDLLEVVEERLIAPRHQAAERSSPSGTGFAAGSNPLVVPVRTLARMPAVATGADTAIRDAARYMTERGVSSILVVDGERCPLGLVTDRDLRSRVVAEDFDTARPVGEVMTCDLITIGENAPAVEALVTMTEHNVHHLPVVDGAGAAIGFVSITDLHLARTTDPVFVVGQLAKAVDVNHVVAIVASVPRMIQQLMAADALAETVGRMVTLVTDAAGRRLCRLAEERLGPPPMDYAFFCFGSQARREQTAFSDQDNALILARKPNPDERSYFDQLAHFVCDGLARAGYRLCPGDIMATNRRWSVSLETWKRYVDAWVAAPTPEAVLNAAVFFDARHLHGQAELTGEYRRWSVRRAQASPLFLGHLAAAGTQFKPPLGFFRRFVVEKDGGHKDQLDLKSRGVTPVIELARVHSLAQGLMETNTFDRIRALADTPALAPDDAAELAVALEHVGYYRLQHQRRQLEVGRQPDNHLDPQSLTRLERENLRRAFITIDKMQDALRRRFQTNQMA
jgi:CBS domain-containing protein